jgi:hypothetical protein
MRKFALVFALVLAVCLSGCELERGGEGDLTQPTDETAPTLDIKLTKLVETPEFSIIIAEDWGYEIGEIGLTITSECELAAHIFIVAMPISVLYEVEVAEDASQREVLEAFKAANSNLALEFDEVNGTEALQSAPGGLSAGYFLVDSQVENIYNIAYKTADDVLRRQIEAVVQTFEFAE